MASVEEIRHLQEKAESLGYRLVKKREKKEKTQTSVQYVVKVGKTLRVLEADRESEIPEKGLITKRQPDVRTLLRLKLAAPEEEVTV